MPTQTITRYYPNNRIRKYFPLFSFAVLILASLFLYQPVFIWFSQKIALSNGYLHLFAALGVMLLAIYRITKLDSALIYPPVFWHPALLLWIPATVLYLLNESNIGFHTLSASLLIVYTYGLSGHFLSKQHWQAILLPMLLLILILPFEHYLDIYLGFPLRLLSAEWAASALQFSDASTATVESILIIDNKAAIVDLDCSGINSLWIGLIFYLLLTWIEKYRIGWRWLLIALAFSSLLVMANVFRIVILVLLDLVFKLPELAMMFHQSLGLLGFIISSLIAWFLLHYFAIKNNASPIKNTPIQNNKGLQTSLFSVLSLLFIILIATSFYQPFEKQNIATIKHSLQLDPKYHAKTVELSQQETDFFVNNESHAQKYSLEINHNNQYLNASLVLVWSKQWRSQHIPENCYLSQGYSISQKGLWSMPSQDGSAQNSLRYLSLNKKQANSTAIKHLTGVYWFQSARKMTPDYSSRVMDALFHPNQEWVMVSILWDQAVNPDIISPFIYQLQNELQHDN